MSFLSWKKKSLNISEKDPCYKVRYLGNVQTVLMKGDGCVDKPAAVLWNNYMRTPHPGLQMKLTLTASGLKAVTKEQGLTEYWAHKISYCIAHPSYPKLFLWVYRHEGKKMKLELRCHAVLCKSEAKARLLALQLHNKLAFALREFVRDKKRKQNSRLVIQRTNSLPNNTASILPIRQMLLSTGQKFRPPLSKLNSAPKLGSIYEFRELEEAENCLDEEGLGGMNEEEEEGEGENEMDLAAVNEDPHTMEALSLESQVMGLSEPVIDIEIGNDIDELKRDEDVQFCLRQAESDDESSESGFSDTKDGYVCDSDQDEMDGDPVSPVQCL